jgi:S-methyl-5-thioribose-1-phosphate isomerase
MKVNGKDYRTVWMEGRSVFMIEQNLLPFEFSIFESGNYLETCRCIRNMVVRGAGAIGAAAGFAMAQACLEAPVSGRKDYLANARNVIESARPTARNLFYAVERVFEAANGSVGMAIEEAQKIAGEDSLTSRKIGEFGSELIHDGYSIATHCNAGWLAFVDYGTALSPVYFSHLSGKNIFVYVDETRPRGQGARLTAWELNNAGIPHAIIPDNAMAWYMSQHKVDLVIVGADRIAANGDTANKIGTLEKAVAAKYFDIPFYVAAPLSTFDQECPDGSHIIIEERDPAEVLFQDGITNEGKMQRIRVCSPGSDALNPAFDVTPAGLITGFITEKGILKDVSYFSP